MRRITQILRERLLTMDDPRGLGTALRSPRSGSEATTPLWRYRVGDWRIVVRIEDEVLRVLVLRIAHRREVYRRPVRPRAEQTVAAGSQGGKTGVDGRLLVVTNRSIRMR